MYSPDPPPNNQAHPPAAQYLSKPPPQTKLAHTPSPLSFLINFHSRSITSNPGDFSSQTDHTTRPSHQTNSLFPKQNHHRSNPDHKPDQQNQPTKPSN
ncbi:uncharacterized protein BO72DRAFT_447276 [Aspergillus fijiensis CBS 313.89]|uniref:Uncharacterized protein n=1 Tax=Aspergillus fijiensis CBS 313.89 TaxID=1448319 RepID=A0A8G1VYY5_9EURO|nr:uncharacterized protein BO72DRAFT_447276 [Aspergillus fijiensis CBS 313.89]RAK78225.1 hypothetical protein BO72DRAFT_447276 [Aspergillus fijiensis CBS 313.89]